MELEQRFVLLRHGQSQWNLENRFTGWTDVPLTEKGRREAHEAARSLSKAGFAFDTAFTSVLRRAADTLEIVLRELDQPELPTQHAWQLNERHYGCLQGLDKSETAERLGGPLVTYWRRSYSGKPPALELDDQRHPRFDHLYSEMDPNALPGGESLQETEERLLPFWRSDILPAILSGKKVLVVAHGNSLRALVRYLEDIPFDQVPELIIPTGVPLFYTISRDGAPVRRDELR
jgi:2,3-bisphosphoglycerate-dependent phosphoglycerate mutase